MQKHRYVHVVTDPLGKKRTYLRSPYVSRIRLPNNQESAAFYKAYEAALAGVTIPIPIRRERSKRQPARPERKPLTGVYLLLLEGEIVYVGTSRNMPNRVAAHRTNGRSFDQVFYIETKEGERIALEALLIRLTRPRQNRNGR